jgi:8-oxo-dGTP diphosphatase
MVGKKTDAAPAPMLVVAAALHRADGRWLMHRRPPGKHHAGLWEFPGGKVEPSEMPVQALERELGEELGITCDACDLVPARFAETPSDAAEGAIVILLYSIGVWQGDPAALEGGAVDWFTPDEVQSLAKPPLDAVLAAQLFQKR